MTNKNLALKFPQVYVVEASAGSGKTHVLAKRYLQLLLDPRLPFPEIPGKNILAITFTNKAAIEMKARILEFLKEIALDKFKSPEEKDSVLAGLSLEKKFACKKAHLAMDYLVKNYNFFQVQTIDSFINSLLCGCAFKLQLSSSFKIKEEQSDYLAYSLDKLIDCAAEDKETSRILENFLRQYLYLENKTGWLPKPQMLSVIISLFGISNTYAGSFYSYPARPNRLFIQKKVILKAMQELCACLPEGTNRRFRDSLSHFLAEHPQGFDIDDIPDFFDNADFPINKGYTRAQALKKLWKNIRRGLQILCELEAYSLFNCYIDIFPRVTGPLRALTNKDDVLFLGELNKQAHLLFAQNPMSVPELYYRLATRLRHFLFDEFQDTNLLQWLNLFPMVEEALSTGGSLFYVGDKKQAIFRFRGGEAGLFDQIKVKFKDFNLKEEFLSKNYRSQKEIVNFNNEIFSPENLERFIAEVVSRDKKDSLKFSAEDVAEMARVFRDSRQTPKPENKYGYIQVERIRASDRQGQQELVREALPALIRQLRQRFNYKDIAILVRKNEDVALMTEWLLQAGIPVESEKTLNIKENPLIKEIISFLKFLHSPIDNLAFASFILGDIFQLACGIEKEKARDFLFQLNLTRKKQGLVNSYLYKEFRQTYPAIWDNFLEVFFKSAGFVPVYELTISILEQFSVFKNFPAYQGFFLRLLELIHEQQQDYPTLGAFLEFFAQAPEDDLYVDVAESDAVKILTIHKAKGLEFSVVILPFLEIEIRVGASTGMGLGNFVVGVDTTFSSEGRIKLLRLKKKYLAYSRALKDIYKDEYKRAFMDELNNVYVAFTRAKNEMYIFIPEKTYRIYNPACFLIREENLERGTKLSYGEVPSGPQELILEISPRHYRDWLNLLKEEFGEEARIRNYAKIQRGEILHFILAQIQNITADNKEMMLKNALAAARLAFPLVSDFKEMEGVVLKLLEDKKTRCFFDIGYGTSYPEKEIVDATGKTSRIDRLIVGEDTVEIIDYKSTADNRQEYRKQIKEYLTLVRDLYPQHRTKGILVYLDTLETEEING